MFTRVNILLTFDTVEEMQRAEGKLITCERENVSHFYGVDMSVEYVEANTESHEITIVASMERTPDRSDAFVLYVYSRFALGASHFNGEFDCIEDKAFFTLNDDAGEVVLRAIPQEHFPTFECDDPFEDPECREKTDAAYDAHATREVIATDDGYTIRRAI